MQTIERVKRLRDEFGRKVWDAKVEYEFGSNIHNKYDSDAARIRDELDVILKDLQKCLN